MTRQDAKLYELTKSIEAQYQHDAATYGGHRAYEQLADKVTANHKAVDVLATDIRNSCRPMKLAKLMRLSNDLLRESTAAIEYMEQVIRLEKIQKEGAA